MVCSPLSSLTNAVYSLDHAGGTPNAALQAPPMAAARHERRLLAVACKRWLGDSREFVSRRKYFTDYRVSHFLVGNSKPNWLCSAIVFIDSSRRLQTNGCK